MARVCPPTPNCVSSIDSPTDAEHHAEPLGFVGEEGPARSRMRAVLLGMPRAAVVTDREGYLHVTFTSLVWRFVDDVELWFDAASGTIQVRSASRAGRSDLGVNRARYDAIAAAWAR